MEDMELLLLPNWQGALLLLLMSTLISTLTFYSDLKRNTCRTKGSLRYLMIWIFGNYIFALILLVLILPEGKGFNEIDRTLLLYCLVAAAMPEASAYLKVQLGNTKQGLDLYKYRMMFSGYISKRMGDLSTRMEWEDSQMLKSAFHGRERELGERLKTYVGVQDLAAEAKAAVLACLPESNGNSSENAINSVLALDDSLQTQLLSYFDKDIRRFEQSARARLMKKLYPPVSAAEADLLVTHGVVGAVSFYLKTTGRSARKSLSEITGIDIQRLALMRHELTDNLRCRLRRAVKNVALIIMFLLTVSMILGTQMGRQMETGINEVVVGAQEELLE